MFSPASNLYANYTAYSYRLCTYHTDLGVVSIFSSTLEIKGGQIISPNKKTKKKTFFQPQQTQTNNFEADSSYLLVLQGLVQNTWTKKKKRHDTNICLKQFVENAQHNTSTQASVTRADLRLLRFSYFSTY